MKNKSLLFIVSLIALILVNITEVRAQRWDDWRFFWKGFSSEEYDDTLPFYVGITLQHSYPKYFFKKTSAWRTTEVPMPDGTTDHFKSIVGRGGSEFRIGIPLRIRLTPLLSFSTGVNYVFRDFGSNHSTRLEYSYKNPASNGVVHSRMHIGDNDFSSNAGGLDVPLFFSLYSNRKYFSPQGQTPYRLYLSGGAHYTSNFLLNKYYDNTKNFEKVDPPLVFRSSYWTLATGLGCAIYTTYNKISIEARFSQSVGSILDGERHNKIQKEFAANNKNHPNVFMDAIKTLGVRAWEISIIFE